MHALCGIVSEKREGRFKVKNISKEGALVVIDRKLRDGETITMTMDVPGDNVPVYASGEVAWQKNVSEDGGYHTGVRFTKIDNHDKGRLLEYIYLQWLKLLDKE
jgi:c-di-GMP-binding flagellar brake protein YcgR